MNLAAIESLIGVETSSAAWAAWWGEQAPSWVQRWRGVAVGTSKRCFVRGPVSGFVEGETLVSLYVDLKKLAGAAMGIEAGMAPAAVRSRFGLPDTSLPGMPALRIPPSDNWTLEGSLRRRVEYAPTGAIELSVFREKEPVAVAGHAKKKGTGKSATTRRAPTPKPSTVATASPARRCVRPQSLHSAFRDQLARLGVSLATMTPRDAVAQMLLYYRDVGFEGRSSADFGDRLLYEHQVQRGTLRGHVVRQLFARGRAVQLDLRWTATRCARLDPESCWSDEEVGPWRVRVERALDLLERATEGRTVKLALSIERL